jgi:hypothetical protein
VVVQAATAPRSEASANQGRHERVVFMASA